MENNPQIGWRLRAGGIISTLYLLIFGMFEAYSAAATALDRNTAFPIWEPHLGWGLFVLPCVLIASLFLLHGRRSGLGFSLLVLNLCLYAGFLIFESIVYRGQPASNQENRLVADCDGKFGQDGPGFFGGDEASGW